MHKRRSNMKFNRTSTIEEDGNPKALNFKQNIRLKNFSR